MTTTTEAYHMSHTPTIASSATCPFCARAAHARACPELRALLFAPEQRETTPADAPGLYRREICYDRDVHAYAMYLDGELVGFQHNYRDADITLDTLVFELTSGQYFREAA